MMTIKKKTVAILTAMGLLLAITACTTPETKPDPSSTPPQSGGSSSVTPEKTLTTGTVGNIRFSYPDDLEVMMEDGTLYAYYDMAAFFFVDSFQVNADEGEVFNDASAKNFFDMAEQSFNEGNWVNGEIITDISTGQMNGIDVWVCEMQMERTTGGKFNASITIALSGDRIVTFTLISDSASYRSAVLEFSHTIKSMEAVG